jgi:hypothetical protein
MNQQTRDRVDTAAIGLIRPDRVGAPAPHARIRRFTTASWLVATGIQFAVWAMIIMVTLDWENPWWLWTFIPGALITAAVYRLTELDLQSRGRKY